MLTMHWGGRAAPHGRGRQRGVSIIELMVGVAVGLFVTGGALSVLANHITGSRNMLRETRLNQDLRAAADLITRDLRRAGYWANAIEGTRASGGVAASNPYSATATPSSTEVTYAFSRGAEDDTLSAGESFGFRLNNGAIEMQTQAGGTPVEITNKAAMTVTAFTITPTVTAMGLGSLCPTPCGPGVPNCPFMTVRRYAIAITGQSVADPNVRRSLRTMVRVRNDRVDGFCT